MTRRNPLVFALCALFVLSSTCVLSQEADEAGLLVRDYETGSLNGWLQVHENVPTVTKEQARAGKFAVKSTLKANAPTDRGKTRTEMRADNSFAELGHEYWYGFGVFLPTSYVPDSVWEIVAQWHVEPDDGVENDAKRQPPLALHTVDGVWAISSKSDSRRQTPSRDGVKSKSYELGPYKTNVWTDWVVNVKWSYKSDGFLKVWQNGKLVVDDTGPNMYNDERGPYFKMGIYKGWATIPVDKVKERTLYHDEFRMAGAEGSYAAVAPGGGKGRPNPPTALRAE